MTHLVLHNPQAASGKGMEIYDGTKPKELLDRVVELLDGEELNPASKRTAGMLMDGKLDEIAPIRGAHALREFSLTGRTKSVHIYLATMGKAK